MQLTPRTSALGLTLASVALAIWIVTSTHRERVPETEGPGSGPPPDAQLITVNEDPTRAGIGQARDPGQSSAEEPLAPGVAVVVLRALDVDDLPLGGADIGASYPEGARELGQTDASGRLEVRTPFGPSAWLVGSKAGFATAIHALPREPVGAIVLRFRPTASIRGRVVLADGGAPSFGVTVAAFPAALASSRDPRAAPPRAPRPSDPCVSLAETGSDGSFAVEGLAEGGLYVLGAGAPGWHGVARQAAIPAGASAVEIPLSRAFAAVIECRDGAGRLALGEPTDGRQSVGLINGTGRRSSPHTLWAELAGLPFPLGRPSPGRSVHLYVADVAASILGELQMEVSVPGFRPRLVQAPVRSLEDGVETVRAVLEPDGSAFGSLELVFAGQPPVPSCTRLSMRVRLTGEDGRERLLPARPSGPDTAVVEGIPHGRYGLVLLFHPSGFQWPGGEQGPATVRIGPGENRLAVPADELGSLELVVRDDRGDPYSGALTLALTDQPVRTSTVILGGQPVTVERGSDLGHVGFPSAPYRLAGLPPGRCHLEIVDPLFADARLDLDVRAGEPAVAELRLGPPPTPERWNAMLLEQVDAQAVLRQLFEGER